MACLTLAGADGPEASYHFSPSCWPAAQHNVKPLILDFLGVLGALGGLVIILASLGVLAVQLLFLVLSASWRFNYCSWFSLAVQFFLRMRSISDVVDRPCSKGMECTAPPQLFTSFAPTIAPGF
jgi:hypothetical protein